MPEEADSESVAADVVGVVDGAVTGVVAGASVAGAFVAASVAGAFVLGVVVSLSLPPHDAMESSAASKITESIVFFILYPFIFN